MAKCCDTSYHQVKNVNWVIDLTNAAFCGSQNAHEQIDISINIFMVQVQPSFGYFLTALWRCLNVFCKNTSWLEMYDTWQLKQKASEKKLLVHITWRLSALNKISGTQAE